MKQFAQTIKRHLSGVLRYHQSQMMAGFLAGTNSLVQVAKRKSRGYRSVKNLTMMIKLIPGRLDYQLLTRNSEEPCILAIVSKLEQKI